MASFDDAVIFALKYKDKIISSVNDTGATEKYGITLRFLREIPLERLRRYGIFEPITEITIRDLTVDQAKLIYKNEFWDGNNFDKIEQQIFCNYIFASAIKNGVSQAIKEVQKRLNIKEDGICGEKTIAKINEDVFNFIMENI